MALFEYMKRTQLLLHDADFAMFNDADLATYINVARGQISGEAECIRVFATLNVIAASQKYLFSDIDLSGAAGVRDVINVRQISYTIASGFKNVTMRPWPWFQTFTLSQPVPEAGPPSTWSQYGQGVNGSIYTNLLDGAYVLSTDTVCRPIDLVDDATVEAIPALWIDAIPFFSSYYAAMTAGAQEKAKEMKDQYDLFMRRARAFATPSVLSGSFAQAPDPFAQNRLGLQPRNQA